MVVMSEKEERRLLGFANGNPNIVADIGNELCKFTTDTPKSKGNAFEFAFFQHAVVEIDEAQYSRFMHYRKHESVHHLLKVWDKDGNYWRFFVVGREAYSIDPGIDPLRGRAKYTAFYYGVMFLRGVLELYAGEPPEAINAFLAHPPGDVEHIDALLRAVLGRWKFESGGQSYVLKVEYANAFDEIIGGVMNTTLGIDGEEINGVEINGDGPTLVFDLGGGTLDLAELHRDGSVNYDKPMVSVRIGVGKAIESAKSIIDQRFKADLGDAEDGISRQDVINMFLDANHELFLFETRDCTDIYNSVARQIVAQAQREVTLFTGGVGKYKRILITGGGAGLFFDEIVSAIFPRHFNPGKGKPTRVHQTDARRDMLKANARGAKKMLAGLKQRSLERLAEERRRLKKIKV